jgi:hypothetical protein
MMYAEPIPKGRIAVGGVLGIVGLILAIIGLVSVGWYTFEIEDIFPMEASYGLSEVEISLAGLGTERASYDEAMGNESSAAMDSATNTKWILVGGIIIVAIFIVLAFVAIFGFLRGSMTWLPVFIGIAAGFVILIASIYFAFTFEAGIEEDSGTSIDEVSSNAGLGLMWILVLVAGILVIIGGGLTKAPHFAG